MRLDDTRIFEAAAQELQCWILVRSTNPKSLAYIGRRGFEPKPISIKAKCANKDVGRYRTGGLVTDPAIQPLAFHDPARAREYWKSVAPLLGQGKLYEVDRSVDSPHYGCLWFRGAYLYGDYDLFDVVRQKRIDQNRTTNLAFVETREDQANFRAEGVREVEQFVNQRFGKPVFTDAGERSLKAGVAMVQHGAEMQNPKGKPEPEPVYLFEPGKPGRKLENAAAIEDHYRTVFKGRRPLGGYF